MNAKPSFLKVVNSAPACACHGFDPVGQHKTPRDVWRMVQHALDLYEEGEDNDIRNERNASACRKWLAKFDPLTRE